VTAEAAGGASLRLRATLLGLFGLLWAALAIDPADRSTWLLENTLPALLLAALIAAHRRVHFSRTTYVLLFVYLCLHTLGAHYTYSLVPYDAWWQKLTGATVSAELGWTRNNYDRVLHFLFGLCLAVPARELLVGIVRVRGSWACVLAVCLVMAASSVYELLEWAAAMVFGQGLGTRFLGTQGDEWDAQRDMALAALGAMLAMLVVLPAAIRAGQQPHSSPGG
jgi:putative membrane protein